MLPPLLLLAHAAGSAAPALLALALRQSAPAELAFDALRAGSEALAAFGYDSFLAPDFGMAACHRVLP